MCLVFDAIFTLIFTLSGLSSSVHSAETICYEQNGYSWHNILAHASASVCSSRVKVWDVCAYCLACAWPRLCEIKALSFIVSAIFAGWGVGLHGAVVTSGDGAPLKVAQLVGVSRYGHILVAWTLLACTNHH